MKTLLSVVLLTGILSLMQAQTSFTVPELDQEQREQVLYNHTIAYYVSGIAFAKGQGISPYDYGVFVGNQFSGYWDPETPFNDVVNRMMYILAGIHPDNAMEIMKQGKGMIEFRLRNVDLPLREGPMLGVTLDEYLQCSNAIIATLAEYVGVKFWNDFRDDGWYVVKLEKE